MRQPPRRAVLCFSLEGAWGMEYDPVGMDASSPWGKNSRQGDFLQPSPTSATTVAWKEGLGSPTGSRKSGRQGRTHVVVDGRVKKEFNYNKLNSKARRTEQIDEMDRRLRDEQAAARALRERIKDLEARVEAGQRGKQRSAALEKLLFSQLSDTAALLLQRDAVLEGRPPPNQAGGAAKEGKISKAVTRESCADWAEYQAHQETARALKSLLRTARRRHDPAEEGSVWGDEAALTAYREVAWSSQRRLARALFGDEFLRIEAANVAAEERERDLEGRASDLFAQQAVVQASRDKLHGEREALQAQMDEMRKALEAIMQENRLYKDHINGLEALKEKQDQTILALKVERHRLRGEAESLVENVHASVGQRLGFVPYAVGRALNNLMGFCADELGVPSHID